MPLKSKSALVTGSTSGIGLAVARALAAAGADVTINGMGEPDSIENERAAVEKDFAVRCRHDGADMTRPAAVRLVTHDRVPDR